MKNNVCSKCGKKINNILRIKICSDCEPEKYKKAKRQSIIAIIIGVFLMMIIIGSTSSNNKSLSDMIIEKDVYNGIHSNIIGKMGYIEISRDKFNDIFNNNTEEYSKLMDKVIENKYKWFIIYFGNNKGLYCNSSICFDCDIKADNDGLYAYDGNDVGTIIKKGESYIYEEIESDSVFDKNAK